MSDDVYDFKNQRGLAVIIVNENFQGDEQRKGAKSDFEMTKHTFAELGFEVRPYFDQTAAQMKQRLQEASQDECLKEVDCFVCILSSHGSFEENERFEWIDWIYGTDDKAVKMDDLLKPVTVAECPLLANKPKLFFVQACRGGRLSEQVLVEEGKTQEVARMRPVMEHGPRMNHLPIQRDFLLAWAVQPGFLALSRPSGSWFIKGLCKIFDQYSALCNKLRQEHKTGQIAKSLEDHLADSLEKFDLQMLMTMVNRYVAEGKRFVSNTPSDPAMHKKKAMPWLAHQLVKDVFLYKMMPLK